MKQLTSTVQLSFGAAVFREFGRTVQAAYVSDLMTFYVATAEFMEAGQAPEGVDLYGPLDRLARACAVTPLPEELSLADLHATAATLWELNDVETLLGKTMGPLRFLLLRQQRALTLAQTELQTVMNLME